MEEYTKVSPRLVKKEVDSNIFYHPTNKSGASWEGTFEARYMDNHYALFADVEVEVNHEGVIIKNEFFPKLVGIVHSKTEAESRLEKLGRDFIGVLESIENLPFKDMGPLHP